MIRVGLGILNSYSDLLAVSILRFCLPLLYLMLRDTLFLFHLFSNASQALRISTI